MRVLRIDESSPYRQLVGVGGIGTGMFFALEGDHTLGRTESRTGRLLDVRDYCKLHIIIHYVAKLLGATQSGFPFHVLPIGKVGDDAPGRQLVKEMSDAGVDTQLVRFIAGSPTLLSVCFQYPNGEGGNITTNNSAAATVTEHDIAKGQEVLNIGKQTVVLAAPEVSLEVRRRLLELATQARAFRVASLVAAEIKAAKDSGILEMLDLLSLNEGEAEVLVGQNFVPGAAGPFVDACLAFLDANYRNLRLIVTAGKAGAYAFAGGRWNHAAAPEIRVVSTAGAGDALLGGVIAALAAGVPLLAEGKAGGPSVNDSVQTALDFGVLLGSYKCLSPHTIHPDASLESLVQFARKAGLRFSSSLEQSFTKGMAPRPAI